MSTNLTTGEVRLSYANLFEARAINTNSEPKFSVTLLIPKSDTNTKSLIDAAIAEAMQNGVANLATWKGIACTSAGIPLHDGDGVRKNGEPYGEECKGHWVITASSKQKPEVVDKNVMPILDQSQIYSGVYAYVSLNFFPYLTSGNKGIGCGLGPVMKIRDGEPLGSKITAAEAFKGFAPATMNAPNIPYTPAPAVDPITGMPIV